MFKRIRRSLGLVVVLLLLIPVSILAAPVGKVSHLEGEADVTREGGKAVVVKLADPVSVGDILRTKAKGKVEVTFLDGNVIWIAEKSRLKITAYEHKEGQKNFFDLFRGKIRAIVNNMAQRSSLELHTPTAVCGVRGTIFIGYFTNGISGFAFERGEGYGYNRTMPSLIVTIGTGQLMQVTGPNQPPVVGPATPNEMNRHLQDTSGSLGTTIAATTETTILPPPPLPPHTLSAVMRTSIVTTVPTTIATTTIRPTTVPTTILTTVRPTTTTVSTTTIPTTVATTLPTTAPTTSIATTTVAPTTVSTTVLPTTVPTTTTSVATTIPPTVPTTSISPTTIAPTTTVPTTTTSVATTVPTTSTTTVQTTVPTTIPTTVSTTVPTTVPTTISTTIATTVPTTVPTTAPTTAPTTIPTTIATTVTTTTILPMELIKHSSDPAVLTVSERRGEAPGVAAPWNTWQSDLVVNAVPSWITSTYSPQGSTETARYWTNYSGATWSPTAITGGIAGAKADWIAATTAVIGGTITGLFDPASATWKAASQGAWMETASFMNKVGTLTTDAERTTFYAQTGIPCFQVGATDLRGYSIGNDSINMRDTTKNSGVIDVSKGILNATFFAPTAGTRPTIWASGTVNGDFTGTPAVGHTVNLQGYQPGTTTLNGISANFTIQKWGTAVDRTWGATVTEGNVPPGTSGFPADGTKFQGGAAGTIKTTDYKFTGTAAGIAHGVGNQIVR